MDGIYVVVGFPHGRHQNSYVVGTAEGGFLVDSGDLEDDAFPSLMAGCER
jgi:hypothetical protein